ncbi:FtsX-like permease family protein [Streptacidiphilus sp. N1-10]|uniref:FtsX-like permease family protein n=1 Tax=Streptacidiphilus jeojiensis TaxID=3229225 RepID=A0ABV6XHI1_9ACTN
MRIGNAALRTVAGAGARRRRLQSLILALVTLGSVAAALLAGQLLVGTSAPFDRGFARQNGAHLTVQIDRAKADAQQVAATGRAPGVTAASGPYPVVLAQDVLPGPGFALPSDVGLTPMTVAGRVSPGGPVDDVSLVSGRWAASPGEIVLSSSVLASARPGGVLTFAGAPGRPRLTVVGIAESVSRTADAWVVPSEVARLSPAGTASSEEMLYRFADTATTAQLTADQAMVTAALPGGATLSAQSYLTVRAADEQGATRVVPPALAAYGILGVAMSVIILAGVVGATVGSSTRRIGILKALGFTPGQVVRSYCLQSLIPCAVGIGLGTVIGTVAAVEALKKSGAALGAGDQPLTLWVELAVPLGAAVLVGLTALLVALRAGRLRTVEALTGRSPKAERGRRAQRVLARTRLPRHISLGLGGPFARPARSLALTASIAFGVLAVTLAIGISSSLDRASTDLSSGSGTSDVQVATNGSNPAPARQQQSDRVAAAIAATPGTGSSYGTASLHLPVSVASGNTDVIVYQGDSSQGHYPLVSGHWFSGSGQAVVPTQFLAATGTRLGGTVVLTYQGRRVPLTLVGEVFDTQQQGLTVMTDVRSLRSAIPMNFFQVEVETGTDVTSYVRHLGSATGAFGATVQVSRSGTLSVVLVLDTLSTLMTLVLVVVAGLGVLGAVVLDTRERVHDLGVYKAVGMTPRQTAAMVLTSVGWLGLIAGAIGVPSGLALHTQVMQLMGDAIGATMPSDVLSVYSSAELVLLACGGIVIAMLGALGPAGWAGRLPTATALRTE